MKTESHIGGARAADWAPGDSSRLCVGGQTARIERGYNAIGGEYLFLLLPAMYYAGNRTILDWIADIREQRREGGILAKTKSAAPSGANTEDSKINETR